jgi:hypothetical protein
VKRIFPSKEQYVDASYEDSSESDRVGVSERGHEHAYLTLAEKIRSFLSAMFTTFFRIQ